LKARACEQERVCVRRSNAYRAKRDWVRRSESGPVRRSESDPPEGRLFYATTVNVIASQ
jgi:hypothetical protein